MAYLYSSIGVEIYFQARNSRFSNQFLVITTYRYNRLRVPDQSCHKLETQFLRLVQFENPVVLSTYIDQYKSPFSTLLPPKAYAVMYKI